VFSINQAWASCLFIRYGYVGIHRADIPLSYNDTTEWFYNWLSQLFYSPILSLVKISILIVLLRLGGQTRNGVKLAISALIAFNVAQCIAVVLVTIFQCSPVTLEWTLSYATRKELGTCVDPAAFLLTTAGLNLVTDMLVLTIPFRIFWDIKFNKRMRNALIFVFMLGVW